VGAADESGILGYCYRTGKKRRVLALHSRQSGIDRSLARHYGFTDEELDFIPSTKLRAGINYDIKYRMGREEESVEDLND